MSKNNRLMNAAINAFPALIFIVDEDARVQGCKASGAIFSATPKNNTINNRVGEIIKCINSKAGCGTSQLCRKCIVRKSIDKVFSENRVIKRRARIVLMKGNDTEDVAFFITASPFTHEGISYALLVIEDIDDDINSLPQIYFETDNEGNLTFVNRQFEIDLGYTLEETIGSNISQFIPAEDLGSALGHFGQTVTGSKTDPYDGRIRKKDGSVTYAIIYPKIISLSGSISGTRGFIVDVTEQKKSELALKESQARLDLAVRSADMGVWTWDLVNNKRFFDDKVCFFLGIDPAEFKGTEQEFFSAVHPDDRSLISLAHQRTLHENVLYAPEYRAVWPDGTIRYISARASLTIDEKGNPLQFSGILWDNTERKQEEEKLMQLAAIAEHSEDAIIGETLYGTISSWNKGAEKIFGYTSEDILGSSVSVLLPGDRKNEEENILQNVLSGGFISQLESQRVCSGGKIVDVSITVSPIIGKSGKILGVSNIIRDITNRKKIEELLRENEERYRAMFINSPDPYFIMEVTSGEIIDCNIAAEAMLGGDRLQIIGKNQGQLSPEFQPDGRSSRNASAEMINESLSKGKNSFEWVCRKFDGTSFWVHVNLSVLYLDGRQVFLVAWRDITGNKEAEKALIEAREAADDANRAKTEFIANTSHEIRTPLNGVIGLTQLMTYTKLTPKQNEYIRKIQASSRALLAILNDILDYSKIDAGHLELEKSLFCLDDILATVSDLFSVRVEEKGLSMVFRVDDDVPHVLKGDSLRLGQVLTNLVGNAVKFTNKGEIQIHIRSLELSQASVLLEISVKDTGFGIPFEVQEHLFSAFTQADSSTTRKFGGTGLGLSISKKLVELMGGEISVKSVPGSGSVFTFSVRLDVSEDGERSRALDESKCYRILVADVSDASIITLKQALESLSVAVTNVRSGGDVLKSLISAEQEGCPYDLIIVDWDIPGPTVFEVVREIDGAVKSGRVREIPIVIMANPLWMELCLAFAGKIRIDGILSKPLVSAELFDLVMNIKGKRKRVRAYSAGSIPDADKRKPALCGIRVLLVEDMNVNQIVAKELLEAMGAVVSLARNGLEALEMISMKEYDVVLMDLQMPVMDGFEATKRIRLKGLDVPIIAMTAAVMIQDKHACLAAGMNDHIPKPIDAELLHDVILKWAVPLKRSELNDKNKTIKTNGEPFSLKGFNLESASERLGLNWNILRKALKVFGADFSGSSLKIEECIRLGDVKEALREIHKIKGSAGNLSADDLYKAARDIEAKASSGAISDLSFFLEKLNDALDTIRCSKEVYFDEPKQCGSGFDVEKITGYLSDITTIIRDHGVVPVKIMTELKEMITESPYYQIFIRLEHQIDHFDYEEALATVNEMAEMLGIKLPV